MSLALPILFHWSPREKRDAIKRGGLKPTCPTALRYSAEIVPGTAHGRYVDAADSVDRMVCLGTSPSHAWSLSGGVFAERGDVWDLWQVTLDDQDEVHPLPFFGHRLDEIRVRNRIPKSRVWWVAERLVGVGRW